ncbi:hypothetical protein HUT16_21525 [Kitasatospora sp. NA04385]|uniref:hypothetical protein n=1 Tax=Kitasatospora sp. NA04385 TaxID=2742135 RepID=UPI0015921ACC|nr:hypothetical protein [Kitasatospora sp. NA04385]QKW21294.1 hypothetical protein HUT16_21525 [Kitasatospora sp. NA04385]
MKRFARILAVAGLLAALAGAAPWSAADGRSATAVTVAGAAPSGDTSWGSCDLPLCRPLS